MVDDRTKKRGHDTPSSSASDLSSRSLTSTNEGTYRQKQRDAVLPFAEHLAKTFQPNSQVLVDDLTTLLRTCKQAFSGDTMLRELEPQVLPIIVKTLLPAVPRNDREAMQLALAELSNSPRWHQRMVILGYAREVSEPNTFTTSAHFLDALRSIDDGRWSFDPDQIRDLTRSNLKFRQELRDDPEFREIDARIVTRYHKIMAERRSKFGPAWD